jgi:hypothetical protein
MKDRPLSVVFIISLVAMLTSCVSDHSLIDKAKSFAAAANAVKTASDALSAKLNMAERRLRTRQLEIRMSRSFSVQDAFYYTTLGVAPKTCEFGNAADIIGGYANLLLNLIQGNNQRQASEAFQLAVAEAPKFTGVMLQLRSATPAMFGLLLANEESAGVPSPTAIRSFKTDLGNYVVTVDDLRHRFDLISATYKRSGKVTASATSQDLLVNEHTEALKRMNDEADALAKIEEKMFENPPSEREADQSEYNKHLEALINGALDDFGSAADSIGDAAQQMFEDASRVMGHGADQSDVISPLASCPKVKLEDGAPPAGNGRS